MQKRPHEDCIGDTPSPSTPAPLYVNWGPHDRCKKLELRREQDIIDAIRHDSKVAEFGCRLGIHPEIAGLPTAPQPTQPHPMRVTGVTRKAEPFIERTFYEGAKNRLQGLQKECSSTFRPEGWPPPDER